jgi:hypothetical protein
MYLRSMYPYRGIILMSIIENTSEYTGILASIEYSHICKYSWMTQILMAMSMGSARFSHTMSTCTCLYLGAKGNHQQHGFGCTMMNSLPAWRQWELQHWDLWDNTGGLWEHPAMYGHMCQWWDCPHGCATRLWLCHQHDACTAPIIWLIHCPYCLTNTYDSSVCLYLDHCSNVYIRRANWKKSPQPWSLGIPTYLIEKHSYLWPCQCVAMTETLAKEDIEALKPGSIHIPSDT